MQAYEPWIYGCRYGCRYSTTIEGAYNINIYNIGIYNIGIIEVFIK